MESGNEVRLVQPVIQGVIIDTEYDKDAKQLRHLVEWSNESGEGQKRWFVESELEVVVA